MCAIRDTCAQRNCANFTEIATWGLDQDHHSLSHLLCNWTLAMSRQCKHAASVNIRLFRSNTCSFNGGFCSVEVERKSAWSSLHIRCRHSVRQWTGASAVANAAFETEELDMPFAACPVWCLPRTTAVATTGRMRCDEPLRVSTYDADSCLIFTCARSCSKQAWSMVLYWSWGCSYCRCNS